MPIAVTNIAATVGPSYIDIRVGECQVHQSKLAVATLAAKVDAGGSLPVGLPIIMSNGNPISAPAQGPIGLLGPESVHLGAVNQFGNVFISGNFNRQAIEDNLGRVLSADELAAIAATTGMRLI